MTSEGRWRGASRPASSATLLLYEVASDVDSDRRNRSPAAKRCANPSSLRSTGRDNAEVGMRAGALSRWVAPEESASSCLSEAVASPDDKFSEDELEELLAQKLEQLQ